MHVDTKKNKKSMIWMIGLLEIISTIDIKQFAELKILFIFC